MALDRERLGGDVALHGRVFVGTERLRIKDVRLQLGFVDAEVGLQPMEITGHAFFGDEQRQLLQVLEFIDVPGCAISTCGSFWKVAAMAMVELSCAITSRLCSELALLQRIGAYEEGDLAHGEQNAVVHVRPAGDDGYVQPLLIVNAVGECLVEAPVLGLRHTIGAKADVIEHLRLRGPQRGGKTEKNRGNSRLLRTLSSPGQSRQGGVQPWR